MCASQKKLLLKAYHDFRGFVKNAGIVSVLPVSFIGVLLLNLTFKVIYELSSLYLFKPFLITITFNKLSLILDNYACDYDTTATKTELIQCFKTVVR